MKKTIKIKLNKNPYKGILKEVAESEGTTQQNVWNAVNLYNNIRIIEIVGEKIKERRRLFNQSKKGLEVC